MDRYINKDSALLIIRRLRGPTRSPAQNELIQSAITGIERLPATDVAPVVHGRWIRTYEDCDLCHECSLCGKPALLDGNEKEVLSPWCPNCGAKMDL